MQFLGESILGDLHRLILPIIGVGTAGALIGFHQNDPVAVSVAEFGVILNPLIQIGEIFLIHGNGVQ